MVRGGNPGVPADTRPMLMARAAPTSPESLRAALRTTVRVPEAPGSAAVRVTAAPDPRFDGRAVYALSVQMPNITSYIGSWIIWFAERGGQPGDSSAIEPPVPLRKVDPKYFPSAIADGVEGRVRLTAVIGRDGRVESVTLIKSLDERLDRSAEEAMRKWEFAPAHRNGIAVEVDALVEIPFHLAPRGVK
jgi:protein TonB